MRRKSTDEQNEAGTGEYCPGGGRATASSIRAARKRGGKTPERVHGTGDDENDEEKEQWIGEHLRKAYDDVLKEPVPDRLAQLLRELEEKERSRK